MTQGNLTQPLGVQPGEILAGKYRVEQVIGSGGMGVVLAAYHLQLEERVAIKMLLPEVLSNAEAVARFTREARAAVKIKSEHVARVSDVGTLDNGAPYMVMELLEGRDLSTWLRESGRLDVEQAVEFVVQACEAIAEAHGLGIVHRDLKPSNLFCVRRSDGLLAIKVLDFGISKVSASEGSTNDIRMTSTSSVFGSPLYMSPEQMLSSRDVDARTDIWALGTILYELLACESPFEGQTMPEVFARIAAQPPPPLRETRPDAPAGLEAVILKCLEKDRNKRYANVAELAVSLAPFAHRRARASVERISRVIQTAGLTESALSLPPLSAAPQSAVGSDTMAPLGHTKANARRQSAVLFVVVLASFVAVTGGIALWILRGEGEGFDKPRVAVAPTASAPSSVPEVSRGTPASSSALPTLPVPVNSVIEIAATAVRNPSSASVTVHEESQPPPQPGPTRASAPASRRHKDSKTDTKSPENTTGSGTAANRAKVEPPVQPTIVTPPPAPANNANNWGGRL